MTDAANATTKVLPRYNSRFNSVTIRGLALAGFIADLVFVAERVTSAKEANRVLGDNTQTEK